MKSIIFSTWNDIAVHLLVMISHDCCELWKTLLHTIIHLVLTQVISFVVLIVEIKPHQIAWRYFAMNLNIFQIWKKNSLCRHWIWIPSCEIRTCLYNPYVVGKVKGSYSDLYFKMLMVVYLKITALLRK